MSSPPQNCKPRYWKRF